jgi:hypothetical protein
MRRLPLALLLSALSAQAQTICEGSCTVTHVVTLEIPVLNLTPEEGALIGGAVLLIWAIGFGVRSVIQTLRVDESQGEKES